MSTVFGWSPVEVEEIFDDGFNYTPYAKKQRQLDDERWLSPNGNNYYNTPTHQLPKIREDINDNGQNIEIEGYPSSSPIKLYSRFYQQNNGMPITHIYGNQSQTDFNFIINKIIDFLNNNIIFIILIAIGCLYLMLIPNFYGHKTNISYLQYESHNLSEIASKIEEQQKKTLLLENEIRNLNEITSKVELQQQTTISLENKLHKLNATAIKFEEQQKKTTSLEHEINKTTSKIEQLQKNLCNITNIPENLKEEIESLQQNVKNINAIFTDFENKTQQQNMLKNVVENLTMQIDQIVQQQIPVKDINWANSIYRHSKKYNKADLFEQYQSWKRGDVDTPKNIFERKQPLLIDPSDCWALEVTKSNDNKMSSFIEIGLEYNTIPTRLAYHHIDHNRIDPKHHIHSPQSIDIYGRNNENEYIFLGTNIKNENSVFIDLKTDQVQKYLKIQFNALEESSYLCIYKIHVYGNQISNNLNNMSI